MIDGDTVWLSANGDEVMLKDMTNGHLVNILNWMRMIENRTVYSTQMIAAFVSYTLESRTFVGFTTEVAYPFWSVDADKWVLMQPDGTTYIEPPPESYLSGVKSAMAELDVTKDSVLHRLTNQWDTK